MKHFATKTYMRDGKKKQLDVVIRLDDECNNGHCDWSITGDVYRITPRGTKIHEMGGCIHDVILKHFPEFRCFVELHLSDAHGAPMYAVENSHYILKTKGLEAAANYMHLPTDVVSRLSGDKELFKYQLFALGIVDMWQERSNKAIAYLESLTGKKWVNPYTKDNEQGVLVLSDDERKVMEERVQSGYYSAEAIAAREKKAADEKRKKERAEIIERYDKDVKKAQMSKAIYLLVFDIAGTIDNVIFYDFKNEVVFNWQDSEYHKTWTRREFYDFCRVAQKRSLVAENQIQFFIEDKVTGRKMHYSEVMDMPYSERIK